MREVPCKQSEKLPFSIPLAILISITAISGCKHGIDLNKHFSEALYDSAMRHAMSGETAHSIAMIDSAYGDFPSISVPDRYRYYTFKYDVFSNHYSGAGNVDSSLRYADSMLSLIEKNDLTTRWAREYARAYSFKGLAYQGDKKYIEAFRYLSMSKFIAKGIPDSCLIANYDGQLAAILYFQAKYREAAALFVQSLNGSSRCVIDKDRFYNIQGCLNSLGLCYHYLGMADSAMYYFEKGQRYIEDNRRLYPLDPKFPDIALGVMYGNEAELWMDRGEFKKAETLLRKDLAINEREGYDQTDATGSRLVLADIYLRSGKKDSALEMLEASRRAVANGESHNRLYWLKLSWRYHTTYSDSLHAAAYHIRYLELKDSILQKNTQILPANADSAYQELCRQYVLNSLKKENGRQTVYMVIFSLLMLKAAAILILFWRNSRRTRTQVQKLANLNNLIVKQNGHVMKAFHALEQSQSDNARMMKIVAHDLRGPIGGILNIVEMMQEGPMESEKKVRSLGLMHQAASGSLTLIGDLLNTNLSEKDISREKIALGDLLQYCIDLLEQSAERKNQQIILHPVNALIEGDREKLWRVFSNLISNAIKFSQEGSSIVLRMEVRGSHVITVIKDQGIGIPDELKDKIFDMAGDARRKGTIGETSFGLGLAISRQIVEVHGGSLWFESQAGKGTSFFVQLSISA